MEPTRPERQLCPNKHKWQGGGAAPPQFEPLPTTKGPGAVIRLRTVVTREDAGVAVPAVARAAGVSAVFRPRFVEFGMLEHLFDARTVLHRSWVGDYLGGHSMPASSLGNCFGSTG
jgi:hypothetical protein